MFKFIGLGSTISTFALLFIAFSSAIAVMFTLNEVPKNINLVAFSVYLQDIVGQVFTMFVLTVAAGEAAIGLAILVVFFRNKGSIHVEDINTLKG